MFGEHRKGFVILLDSKGFTKARKRNNTALSLHLQNKTFTIMLHRFTCSSILCYSICEWLEVQYMLISHKHRRHFLQNIYCQTLLRSKINQIYLRPKMQTYFRVGASVLHSGRFHSSGTWIHARIAPPSPPTVAWGYSHLILWGNEVKWKKWKRWLFKLFKVTITDLTFFPMTSNLTM